MVLFAVGAEAMFGAAVVVPCDGNGCMFARGDVAGAAETGNEISTCGEASEVGSGAALCVG